MLTQRTIAKVIAAKLLTAEILDDLALSDIRPKPGKEAFARERMAEIIVRHLDAYDQRS